MVYGVVTTPVLQLVNMENGSPVMGHLVPPVTTGPGAEEPPGAPRITEVPRSVFTPPAVEETAPPATMLDEVEAVNEAAPAPTTDR